MTKKLCAVATVAAAVLLLLLAGPLSAQQAEAGKNPPQAGKSPLKVFILAGQSNMVGYGGIGTLDALGADPAHAALLKKIKKADGSFVVCDDVFIDWNQYHGPLTVGQAGGPDRIGPELTFGMAMGDYCQGPVLLIKTAWGGTDLYCDWRPPSAGKPAYVIPGPPREMGGCYKKMVAEVHRCLDHIDADFPQFQGSPHQLCGFVWFQGWNERCADGKIKPKIYEEYPGNFAHLLQDVRAEFKAPLLPAVVGELGVGGETPGDDILAFRAAQAKIPLQAELRGTVAFVRTAPFWGGKLDALQRTFNAAYSSRILDKARAQVKKQLAGKPEAADPRAFDRAVSKVAAKAEQEDPEFQKIKAEHDQQISHWDCHYYGSARTYCLIGNALAEAMIDLLRMKSR